MIACREKYIPTGEKERNVVSDITDHRWFDQAPFDPRKGVIFLAAGVLHYLSQEAVRKLVSGMAERFPGGVFVFDFVSSRGAKAGNAQIDLTQNETRITFAMENAERELPAYSDRIAGVVQKSYLEGYPVEGVRYNRVTRLYIKFKRDQYFVVRVEFQSET